jgi:hypothetical protein
MPEAKIAPERIVGWLSWSAQATTVMLYLKPSRVWDSQLVADRPTRDGRLATVETQRLGPKVYRQVALAVGSGLRRTSPCRVATVIDLDQSESAMELTKSALAALKDVVYFFHLQSDYAHIEYDLPWAQFTLPYWRFLGADLSGELSPADAMLVERGCLLIICAACMAHAANVAEVFTPAALDDCGKVVSVLHYSDDACSRLRNTTERAIAIAAQPNHRLHTARSPSCRLRWDGPAKESSKSTSIPAANASR